MTPTYSMAINLTAGSEVTCVAFSQGPLFEFVAFGIAPPAPTLTSGTSHIAAGSSGGGGVLAGGTKKKKKIRFGFGGKKSKPKTVSVRVFKVCETNKGKAHETLAGSLESHLDGCIRIKNDVVLHQDVIRAVSFDPSNADIIATSPWDGTVVLAQVSTGDVLHTLKHHSGKVSSVQFNPKGTLLATAGEDASLCLFNYRQPGAEKKTKATTADTIQDPRHPLATLRSHSAEVTHLTWSRDDSAVASASADMTVIVYEFTTHTFRQKVLQHTQAVERVAISPQDSSHVATCHGCTVMVWSSGALQGSVVLPFLRDSGDAITDLMFVQATDNGDCAAPAAVVAVASCGTIAVIDPADLTTHTLFPVSTPAHITCIDYSHDGTMFACGTKYGGLQLYPGLPNFKVCLGLLILCEPDVISA